MMWRLKDLPAYSTGATTVEASDFNLIRRAVMKSHQPIRIPFKNMPHVDMLIDESSWVCVDNSNNDMPIVAWVEFDTEHRNNLHEPISCIKNYYHYAAGKIAAAAFSNARAYLTEHYAPAPVCNLVIPDKPKKVWKTSTAAELSCV